MKIDAQMGGGAILVTAIVFIVVIFGLIGTPLGSIQALGGDGLGNSGQFLAVAGAIIVGIGLLMFAGSKTGISSSKFLGLSGSTTMILGFVFLLLILILTTAGVPGLTRERFNNQEEK
jgi:hypothetical protein